MDEKECTCDVPIERFVYEDGKIIDTEDVIAPLECEPEVIIDFLNSLEKDEPKEACVCEETLKMMVMFETEETYHINSMFRYIQFEVESRENDNIYVFFDMGSVKLDIMNPLNHIFFNDDFTEVYNDVNGETTIIRNSEIKGFVFEPYEEPVTLKELINEVDND